MRCPNCGYESSPAPFCVRCGEPLDNRGSPYPLEDRGYAAQPHEPWYLPGVISSLFPHLPRRDMDGFRIGLFAGVVTIVVFCTFDLFPLALIVAATLVPLLSVIYLWSVDVYEDEPVPMLAATVLWGVGSGIGLGLAARHLSSDPSPLRNGPPIHDVIWLGAFLPLVTVVLALSGPLLLLPYRRFNDVLDGAIFGGTAAVFTLGAEAITNSSGFIGGGLKAGGDVGSWVGRLLILGVALPVLAAGTIGAAAASFWLRYRAPVRDRSRLGLAGTPAVAVLLAACGLVGTNLCEFYVGEWWTLAIVGAVALLALVALRRVIHLGLIEEAVEREVGPPISCPNCGRETPSHTFCAQCGVSLQALPKGGERKPGRAVVAHPRLRRPIVLVAVGALGAAVVGLSVLLVVLVRPGPVEPPCQPHVPCATPRIATRSPAARARTATNAQYVYWNMSPIGPNIRFWSGDWSVLKQDSQAFLADSKLTDTKTLIRVAILISPAAIPAGDALQAQISANGDPTYLGLSRDTSSEHEILGPEIGYLPASAEVYKATLNEPPSPQRRVELMFEGAANGAATVVVEAVTSERAELNKQTDAASPFPALAIVDGLIDDFRWSK